MKEFPYSNEQNHIYYVDNFYISLSPSSALHECQTFMIGTAQVNRKGFLESLWDTKHCIKQLNTVTTSQCLFQWEDRVSSMDGQKTCNINMIFNSRSQEYA